MDSINSEHIKGIVKTAQESIICLNNLKGFVDKKVDTLQNNLKKSCDKLILLDANLKQTKLISEANFNEIKINHTSIINEFKENVSKKYKTIQDDSKSESSEGPEDAKSESSEGFCSSSTMYM